MTQDNSIVIREYLTTDKEVVMNLIKLNTPNFFAKEEVNDLSNYLDKGIELYYVLLVDGKVVGCGGINFAEKRTIGKRDGAAALPLFASSVSVAGVVVKAGQWLCPAPAAHRRAIVVVLAP